MTHDPSHHPPGPDLRKPDRAPRLDPPAASIWEPLDGSVPPRPQAEPGIDAWGRPHAPGAPSPSAVAAAYTDPTLRPAGSGATFILAGWGSRFAAFLIDSILFGLLGFALVVPVGMWQGLTLQESAEFFSMLSGVPESVAKPEPLYAALVIQRLVVGMIPAFFLVRWNGQTPGKRALDLRVMRADGGPLDLSTAMRRELLGRTIVVDTLGLLTFGLVALANYLWPLWDPQRRTGHDAIAHTRVVTAPRQG